MPGLNPKSFCSAYDEKACILRWRFFRRMGMLNLVAHSVLFDNRLMSTPGFLSILSRLTFITHTLHDFYIHSSLTSSPYRHHPVIWYVKWYRNRKQVILSPLSALKWRPNTLHVQRVSIRNTHILHNVLTKILTCGK
jgi:hypothetical protein